MQPKPEWEASDYRAAAARKLDGSRRLLAELDRHGGSIDGASALEVGCGAGIDCLLLALNGAARVVGIDLELPLHDPSERGRRVRRLTRAVLEERGMRQEIDQAFEGLPVELRRMNATRLDFPDASFDLLVSRAALEHIRPVEPALSEMARVVRPGGLVRHSIDPFFWLRGCHKGGLVDIPWAHARLRPEEYARFVTDYEAAAKVRRRVALLGSLNQLGLRRWRALFEAGPFEIVAWREDVSPLAESLLEQHPDVLDTVLEDVTARDLVHSSIRVWLRRRHGSGR